MAPTGNTSTIYIMNDIIATATTTMNSNKSIVLTSYSTNNTINSIKKENVINGSFINQTSGTLTLQNIILSSHNRRHRYDCNSIIQ